MQSYLVPWVQLRLLAQDERVVLHDEVSGPLLRQIKETSRLLFEQYLPMAIAASGSMNDPAAGLNFPSREAVREALLGALAHKDYACGQPVSVDVFPSRMIIRNPTEAGAASLATAEDSEAPVIAANPVLTRAMRLVGIMDDGTSITSGSSRRTSRSDSMLPFSTGGRRNVNHLSPGFGEKAANEHPPRDFDSESRRQLTA